MKSYIANDYISLSPNRKIEHKRSDSKNTNNISNINDYNFHSFLQEKKFNEIFQREKPYENKFHREYDKLTKILKENSPLKSPKNKPVINLDKPHLNFNSNNYMFCSPNKFRKFSSNKKLYKNLNNNYNFTNKIGENFVLKKYSKNNVLMINKTIKANDSFEEFARGI